jgi:hypothetical protein
MPISPYISGEKHKKMLSTAGPVGPKNLGVPFTDMLWVQQIQNSLLENQSIFLHGPWQSGKTGALLHIRRKEEGSGRKVVFIDAACSQSHILEILNKKRSIFSFLAYHFGAEESRIRDVHGFLDFIDSLELTKSPLLIIDQFDSVLRMEGTHPQLKTDFKLLIEKISNESGKYLNSVIFSGHFSSLAVPVHGFDFIDHSQAAGDDYALEESAKLSEFVLTSRLGLQSADINAIAISADPLTLPQFSGLAEEALSSDEIRDFDVEIIQDIFNLCSGHAGFCTWYLFQAVLNAMYSSTLNFNEWRLRKSDISIYHDSPTFNTMIDICLRSKKLKEILKEMIRSRQHSTRDIKQAAFFLSLLGVARFEGLETIVFASPSIENCFRWNLKV